MKFYIYFLVTASIISTTYQLFGVNDQDTIPRRTEGKIIMIVDEDEQNGVGPNSYDLAIALEQQAAPILVSGSLFTTFVNKLIAARSAQYAPLGPTPAGWINMAKKLVPHGNFSIFNSLPPGEQQKIAERYDAMQKPVSPITFTDILLGTSTFDPSKWEMGYLKEGFVLLIPRLFFAKIKMELAANLFGGGSSSFEMLGFKSSALQTINSATLQSLSDFLKNKEPEMGKSGAQFIFAIRNLFLTRTDYGKQKGVFVPEWTVLLTGHGFIGTTISGMPIPQFRLFLDFLENNLTTKILVYVSCYSAGFNFELVYTDLKNVTISKTYSFAIITAALTDSPSGRKFSHSINQNAFKAGWDGKLFTHNYPTNFTDYFKKATDPNAMLDYSALAATVIPPTSTTLLEGAAGVSAAQIRLPGLSWFSVVEAQTKFVSIGRVMAATHDPNKPLNIMDLFKQQQPKSGAGTAPLAILLYTNDVPFTLDLSTVPGTLPEIISMLPGSAVHHIKGITIGSTNTLSDLFNKFIHIGSGGGEDIRMISAAEKSSGLRHKVFLIDACTRTDKAASITLKNVLIDVETTSDRIFFEYENQTYTNLPSYGGEDMMSLLKNLLSSLNLALSGGISDDSFISKQTPATSEEVDLWRKKLTQYRAEVEQKKAMPQERGLVPISLKQLENVTGQLKKLQAEHKERVQKEELKRKSQQPLVDVSQELAELLSQLTGLSSVLAA